MSVLHCRICGALIKDITINSPCPICGGEGKWANNKEALERVRRELNMRRALRRAEV